MLPTLENVAQREIRSVVVMDNCPMHNVENLNEMARGVGALIMFLPTYSPDCNPIENAFDLAKAYLTHFPSLANAFPKLAIETALQEVTPEHAEYYFAKGGYSW